MTPTYICFFFSSQKRWKDSEMKRLENKGKIDSKRRLLESREEKSESEGGYDISKMIILFHSQMCSYAIIHRSSSCYCYPIVVVLSHLFVATFGYWLSQIVGNVFAVSQSDKISFFLHCCTHLCYMLKSCNVPRL